MASPFPSSLSLEQVLLSSKALEPLTEDVIQRLREVQQLDVTDYTEADVRAEVIDPIIRALGYAKQTYFSLEREKHLKLMEKDLFIDYNMTLMQENFWVIEAKKVKRKAAKFIESEVHQALLYAAHPEINAALLVLCNGQILHVFDREESLEEPILELEIKNLVQDFNKLRAVLSPWQIWFFEKRRVIRLIDKVFDREPNLNRLAEFRSLLDGHLSGKRSTVLRNFQALASKFKDDDHASHLRSASIEELVNLHFFYPHSIRDMSIISERLISLCGATGRESFRVLYTIFPDLPRVATHNFWPHALHFLMALHASGKSVNWLPQYLREPGNSGWELDIAIKGLISLCLTGFKSEPGFEAVLRYSTTARRMAKQILITHPETNEIANRRHAFIRHHVDELSWNQFVASPEGQKGHLLDSLQYAQIESMVSQCSTDKNDFSIPKAVQLVKDAWVRERQTLKDGRDYLLAKEASGISDGSEYGGVTYDELGHGALCIIDLFPQWKRYTMDVHEQDIHQLLKFGSWMACKWLGVEVETTPPPQPTIEELATKFFGGDTDMLISLAAGYGIAL